MKLWEILKLADEGKLNKGDKFKSLKNNVIIKYENNDFIEDNKGMHKVISLFENYLDAEYKKINTMSFEDWFNIPVATKVKYKDNFGKEKYGYFAGVFEVTKTIKISKIKENDIFTGVNMTDYGICENIKYENVELYKESDN